jgi:hypothetical protein
MSENSDLTKTLAAASEAPKPVLRGARPERLDKQSRAGVASFVLSVVATVAVVHTVLRFRGLPPPAGSEDGTVPGAAVYVTIAFGGALVLEVVALVLGFMGTFQRHSRRTMGGAGLALAAAILLAVLSVPLL